MHDEANLTFVGGTSFSVVRRKPETLQLEILKVKEHKDETQSFSDLNASSRL